MTDAFHKEIRASLANPGLQAALDGNAERRLRARENAFASLPEEWPVMRARAHAVRANTIANLDEYLEKFTSKARANGLIVHQASGAEQAIGIIKEIAAKHQAAVIAKSKTMVSEEIGLNHALEAAGIRAVETDLGEYIIQLRGERPAHIITPAVHLRRGDVSQTFHEKLGLPLTDDIAVMTAAARRKLRQTFLEARIGLSGVNFGVAETGSLCLVTNEGNGRMVTTLPPVHIALMGLERLVPSMDDLALMLALLARSATGQKLTVYTNLINGPRRAGEPDGAQERHLIILDNGRRAMRESALSEALLCIRCGACLNACPVFREIGGHGYVSVRGEISTYPGPIGSIVSPGLFGQSEFGQLAQASSLCGACKEACPVDIDLPKLLLRVRAGGLKARPNQRPPGIPASLTWILRIYAWMASDYRRFSLAQKMAGVLGRLIAPRHPWLRMPAFTGWGLSRDFPRPASRTFRARWSSGGWNAIPEAGGARASGDDLESTAGELSEAPAPDGSPLDRWALMARFTTELAALGGETIICRQEELSDLLLQTLGERGITRMQAWEAEELPEAVSKFLEQAGIKANTSFDPEAQAGLTGCLAAIADTGTLVITGGHGRPLAASLVPEIHIALMRASQLYAQLDQVLNLKEVYEASSAVLVTGPSRTADIEMTLTIGVHGPRELIVFCLSDG